jgi:protein-tyrosine phosphatase
MIPKRVLLVCLGNICRSPMAEGILRAKLLEHGMHIELDSCGTSAQHKGEAPDRRAVQCAATHGVDIASLRSRPIASSDVAFDLILVMDKFNLRDVRSLWYMADHQEKVRLFLEEAVEHGDVPDPWYGDERGFESVFQLLDGACEALVQKWK